MKQRNIQYTPLSTRRAKRHAKNRVILTVLITALLIYSLFTWILPTLIGSLSLLNHFKSPPRQNTPISEDTTLSPPVLNIPYEATNSARIKIRGYSLPNTKVEIYIDDNLKTIIKTSDQGDFTTDEVDLSLGTNNIFGKTINDKDKKSLPSKSIRIVYSNEKPNLNLKEPTDNQIIKGDKKVTVSGSISPKDNITVTINDLRVITNRDGDFSQAIDISDGENNLVIKAIDLMGNTTQVSRKVIFEQ